MDGVARSTPVAADPDHLTVQQYYYNQLKLLKGNVAGNVPRATHKNDGDVTAAGHQNGDAVEGAAAHHGDVAAAGHRNGDAVEGAAAHLLGDVAED